MHFSKLSMFIFIFYAIPVILGIVGFWAIKAIKGDHFENVFTILVDSGTVLVPYLNLAIALVALWYLLTPVFKIVSSLFSSILGAGKYIRKGYDAAFYWHYYKFRMSKK